ncbi:MAG: hypothetical protein M3N12_03360 [Verrucomicrobiota bacterium]|nr:hypothetical protein [Verrucomicrobiota bacterium]
MTRKTVSILLILGTFVGLALKWSMLFHMGTFDMDSYFEWGRRALEIGLPRSYHGIYFPIQYQLFECCAWMVAKTGAPFFTIYKVPSLLCDFTTFWVVVLLLRRGGANPLYGLLYWLHPWFLTVFSLGYCDFQFSLCVVLSVWLLRDEEARSYLLAGLPLAVAFLMKPQAQVLIVATFAYGLSRYLRNRDSRPLALLVPPTLLFLAYELWFTRALPRPRFVAAQRLPLSYLNITNIMPALTALMTNIWYPIAYLLKKPGQGVHTVSDQIHLLPYLQAKYLMAVVVLGLVCLHAFRVEREKETSPSDKFVKIFGFAALAVPFLMTSAHENHLFLGSVFLVLLVPQPRSLFTKVAIQVLLLIQFLNIYSLYGTHPQWLAHLFKGTQSDELTVAYSIVAVVCFAFIAKPLWSPAPRLARPAP